MMTFRTFHRAVLAASLAVAGCATMPHKGTASIEELLAAAGFQKRPADTPERLAHLNAMPRQKLVVANTDGNAVYTYADPDGCQCFYVGGSKEYSAYQRLLFDRESAADTTVWPGLAPREW